MPRRQNEAAMIEKDALIGSYTHLKDFSRSDEALQTLKKIASVVKPIMRGRKWTVGKLAEFYPSETNLLGLNCNRGQKICLRLRYAGDKDQLLPWEDVLDTMLHELCHNVIGPHNTAFNKLWDTLRDEMEGLMAKGYTGEGFLGNGRRLGGSPCIPPDEARRLARKAAEERAKSKNGGGHRLGGKVPRSGQDMRKIIADAAQRRNETLKGCASEKMNERQIQQLADTATRNGFQTKAEEDEANEVAIAQALWELVQEDEKKKYGSEYVSRTHGGWQGQDYAGPPSSSYKAGRIGGGPASSSTIEVLEDVWVCNVCTLHNPRNYLACEACGTERTNAQAERMIQRGEARRPQPAETSTNSKSKKTEVVDLTTSPPPKRDGKRRRVDRPIQAPPGPVVSSFWHCKACTTKMESKWWTCSTCGRMKDSSS